MAPYTESISYTTIPSGSFRISYPSKKSKTIEFFDDLYSYPPKFRVKWDTIDELHEDLFMSYNYRIHNTYVPFLDVVKDFFSNEDIGSVKKINYSVSPYVKGYFNNTLATRFYGNFSKKLQGVLQTVPIYTILNGQGEIVLANSTDFTNSNGLTPSTASYNFCGSFDPTVDGTKQLGLFFMSKNDAEIYLNEIAQSDTQGTRMLGLSIHCFGLDFAYRVTREYHPNIDFRFIPDMDEVQSLMTRKTTGDANLVFDNNQQQLRFRRRPLKIIPGLNSLANWFFPLSSFVEKTEYFKGVPIYVVTVNDNVNNFFVERYFNVVNVMDTFYSGAVKSLATVFGFGNNWILQGSSSELTPPNKKTFIFFEKEAVKEFCRLHSNKINRYKSTHSNLFEPITKKPKILVYNLEDFFEVLEEKLTLPQPINTQVENIGDEKSIYFIPSKQVTADLTNFLSQNKKPTLQKLTQFFDFKYRRLTGFFEILLNTN